MSPDERAEHALPLAVDLVGAVTAADRDQVAAVLARVTDWQALAVVLAAHIPSSVLAGLKAELDEDTTAGLILNETADRFRVPVHRILSADRHRDVLDARAVAMAAMRYAGLSSPYIGRVMDRDHSTVLHAASRVGETARLRRIAVDLAALTGVLPGVLGDANETTTEGAAA